MLSLESSYSFDPPRPDTKRSTRTAGGTDSPRAYGLETTCAHPRALLVLATGYSEPAPQGESQLTSDGVRHSCTTSRAVHSSRSPAAIAIGCLTLFALSSWGRRSLPAQPALPPLLLQMTPRESGAYMSEKTTLCNMGPPLGASAAALSLLIATRRRRTQPSAGPDSPS